MEADEASRERARLRALEMQLWAGAQELRLRGDRLNNDARQDLALELSELEREVERLRSSLGQAGS